MQFDLPTIEDDPNENFAGDLSSIYINPNEISMNMQSNRLSVIKPMDSVVGGLKGSIINTIESIPEGRPSNMNRDSRLRK